MAISSMGIGSGLDLNQIVGQLVQAERAPQERRMEQREERLEAEVSAFGMLRNSVDQAQISMSDLSRFRPQQTAVVSQEGVASISADGSAANGQVSLEVQQLAQAQSLATQPDAFASRDAEVGAGQLSIQVGDRAAVAIDVEAGDTLADVRDAINTADAGVTASIVNDGSGARLVLSAEESGAANTIQVTVDGDAAPANDGLGRLASGNLAQTQEARDAVAVINGLTVTSPTNTLDDTIDGLNIELQGQTTGPVSVTVSEDRDALRAGLEQFIENYNTIRGQIRELTAYDPEAREASILTGDSTVRSMENRLSSALMNRADVPGANNTMLAELGVTRGVDGELRLDADRFSQAMAEDGFDNVSETVRQVAGGMNSVLSSFLGSDGLLRTRTDGIESALDRVAQDRARMDDRMERLESRLTRQFSQMDAAVAQLQSSGDYLLEQLANTPLARNNSR